MSFPRTPGECVQDAQEKNCLSLGADRKLGVPQSFSYSTKSPNEGFGRPGDECRLGEWPCQVAKLQQVAMVAAIPVSEPSSRRFPGLKSSQPLPEVDQNLRSAGMV